MFLLTSLFTLSVKTVEVDARVVGTRYTVDQADLAKYFAVSKDADNKNNLTVEFVVKTTGAPDPAPASTVVVSEDANPAVVNYVLAKNVAVIKDWTNVGTFDENVIEVEAILYANGFELDRKPVTLHTKDPLTFSVTTPVREPRYTDDKATVNTLNNVSVKTLKGDALTVANFFGQGKTDEVYGANVTAVLKRVYYKNGENPVAYESSKYEYKDGVITLHKDNAVLHTSIFAEIEYVLTHRLNEKTEEQCTKTVVVEFYPAERK